MLRTSWESKNILKKKDKYEKCFFPDYNIWGEISFCADKKKTDLMQNKKKFRD